ncbi:heptaprenyl diphosphate synthase component 1 [Domibacillus enclensis]|uniref:Heptaprenyl diphosphate synthase n=1 Tax=Domibacillus enclensis TaxID=1017273 RepID=A0A1N6P8Z7_9BACI|nr:heptaprenyl diphosphate synthase component 1 [Domibacillus enclensis]OXS80280.1 hypothetical protein B1B05_02055 [Domibacillus enclensis]SIQ00779.1 heptaprenyl diphosphate synthase [Domibacillus enclensis]
MTEWQEQKRALLEEINQACRQPFLDNVLGHPAVNPLRASALMLAFDENQRRTDVARKQMTAAVLIQMALDTHDLIPPLTEEMTRENQLIVLAGDYYSGMYYQTLAEAGCIHWVGVLAEAVKKVNETKTALHSGLLRSEESVFQAVQTIESDIIRSVYTEVNADEACWSAVCLLLELDRLQREKKKPIIVVDALERVCGEKKKAMDAIDRRLEKCQSDLNKWMKNVESSSAAAIQAEWDRVNSMPLRLVGEG